MVPGVFYPNKTKMQNLQRNLLGHQNSVCDTYLTELCLNCSKRRFIGKQAPPASGNNLGYPSHIPDTREDIYSTISGNFLL
jgi:hypothetical protein